MHVKNKRGLTLKLNGLIMFVKLLGRLLVYIKFRLKRLSRRKHILLALPLALWALVAMAGCWWFARVSSTYLLPPPPPDQNLQHFRRSRSLSFYMDNINLLIEPDSTACEDAEELPVIVMVTTVPRHSEQRQAIRSTYAKYQPTFFLMGLDGDGVDEKLVDTYVEAKQYGDMIVYDFRDHYQNLTLKSALMMRWTAARCPLAQFMFKADDDVILNPWTLKTVLTEHPDAKLLGYRRNNTYLHRDEYTKWYVPRWLCPTDVVEAYLTGPGYLVSGDYLKRILRAAQKVPLVNVEDVYFSYLVSMKTLGLELTHDPRISSYKPWFPSICAYWVLASAHSLTPGALINVFRKLELMAERSGDTSKVCHFYRKYIHNEMFMY